MINEQTVEGEMSTRTESTDEASKTIYIVTSVHRSDQKESSSLTTPSYEMSSLQDLKYKGQNLRKRLNHVAHALEDTHKFINGMKFLGSFYAFAGGVMTVVSAIAAIPTGGLTLPLSGAGMIISGAGGGISLGASLSELIIEKLCLYDLQKEWDEFVKSFREEIESNGLILAAEIGKNATLVFKGFEVAMNGFDELAGVGLKEVGGRLAIGATKLGKAAKDGGLAELGKLGAKAIGKELFFLNVAFLPINFIDLVKTIIDLRGNEKSEACQIILKLAKFTEFAVNMLTERN